MVDREDQHQPVGALKRRVDRLKAHPLIAVSATVVALGAFLINAEGVFVWGREKVNVVVNPNSADYQALQTLDLDTRLEYFEANFGTARAVYDLCEEALICSDEHEGDPRMYLHATDDVVIRAVFHDEQLQMYAVTLMSDKLAPEIEWLDVPLGRLGEVSFAEALDGVDGIDGPTDLEIFMGPQATAYAEVVAAGAPAQYRGLLLAHAPAGYSGPGTSFDTDAALQMSESQLKELAPAAGTVDQFRSSSTPNTFGEFRDDGGTVGVLMREAQNAVPLLFIGTEL